MQWYAPFIKNMLDNNRAFPKRPRLLEKEYYKGFGTYFITICTVNKLPLFAKTNIVNSAIKYLQPISQKEKISIVIYCFMPNHVHFLLQGNSQTSDVLRFVRAYKQLSGFRFASVHRHKLWATSFYDHVLKRDEAEPKISRYILENPMRMGLSETIFDYPYAGSLVFTKEQLAEYILLA